MAHITGEEVALAGIGGTLLGTAIGGVIGYLSQKHSTSETLAAQRKLAKDERLWQRRVEVYPELTQLIIETVSMVIATNKATKDQVELASAHGTRRTSIINHWGAVASLGSDKTSDAFEVFFRELSRVDLQSAISPDEAALKNAANALLSSMTSELHDDRTEPIYFIVDDPSADAAESAEQAAGASTSPVNPRDEG